MSACPALVVCLLSVPAPSVGARRQALALLRRRLAFARVPVSAGLASPAWRSAVVSVWLPLVAPALPRAAVARACRVGWVE
ncbi:MAG: hypothetical protein WDN49_09370 [Acetobacteraceae bacterium]